MEGKIDSAKSKLAVSEFLILDLSEMDPYWRTQDKMFNTIPLAWR